jgi:2'-5' RNA ligase
VSQALFPGWRPNKEEAARLAPPATALQDGIRERGLKLRSSFRTPDQWHVTLCFIGKDAPHLATPSLREQLARAAAQIPPHAFRIERLAYWSGSGVIVALPSQCHALQALCDATRDAIRRSGIIPVLVTTQPHLTLAYLEKHLEPQGWLDDIDCTSTGTFLVDRFELLFNPGGHYDALGSWALTGAELPRPPEQGSLS